PRRSMPPELFHAYSENKEGRSPDRPFVCSAVWKPPLLVSAPLASATFKFLQRFAQASLVRGAHLAKRQSHFRRDRPAPRQRRLYRHRIRFDKQIFEQPIKFAVQSLSPLDLALGKCAD